MTVGQLKALYLRRLDGERTEDLSSAAGISANALNEAWRRCGWRAPRGQTVWAINKRQAAALYLRRCNGERTKDLAAEAGLRITTLCQRWRKLGFPERRRVEWAQRHDAALFRATLLKMEGRTWREVYGMLVAEGLSRWSSLQNFRALAWRYAAKHGLPIGEPLVRRAA